MTRADDVAMLDRFLEHVSEESVRAGGGSKEAARGFLEDEQRRGPPDLARDDFCHLAHSFAELAGQPKREASALSLNIGCSSFTLQSSISFHCSFVAAKLQ